MNISLTPELEKLVREKVNSGRYQSSSEDVRKGLRLLEQSENEKRQRIEEARTLIREGLDSGNSSPLTHEDYEQVKQRGRKHLGLS